MVAQRPLLFTGASLEGLTGVDQCLWGNFLPLLPTPFTKVFNPTGPALLGTHHPPSLGSLADAEGR